MGNRVREIDTQREVVEVRAIGAAISAGNAGGEQSHLESQSTQQSGESSVEFVAKTTAALIDDLVKKAVFVANNGAAKVDIEILKRHGKHVRAVQRP